MDSNRLVRRESMVYPPNWEYLRQDDGPHYIFGTCYREDGTWTTLDLDGDPPFDLVKQDFPFTDVSAIHCVSIVHCWDYIDTAHVLRKSYRALRPGGVMWLGEDNRDVDVADGGNVRSFYSARSLTRMLSNAGFGTIEEDSILKVTGRVTRPRFALKATK